MWRRFSQITLHLDVAFDVVTQLGDLIVAQVLGAQVPVDAGGFQDLLGAGTADAVDIGQRDLHALVAREIYAHETCHQAVFPFRSGGLVPARSRPWRGSASVPNVVEQRICSVVLGFHHSVV